MGLPSPRGSRGSAIHVFLVIISYYYYYYYELLVLFPQTFLYFNCCITDTQHRTLIFRPVVTSNIFTSFTWNKTDIVKLGYVTQHKSVATSNIILWADHYVIVMTADHLNARFKVVCYTMENQVVTPCTVCHHFREVGIPRWVSINKLEEICPIWL